MHPGLTLAINHGPSKERLTNSAPGLSHSAGSVMGWRVRLGKGRARDRRHQRPQNQWMDKIYFLRRIPIIKLPSQLQEFVHPQSATKDSLEKLLIHGSIHGWGHVKAAFKQQLRPVMARSLRGGAWSGPTSPNTSSGGCAALMPWLSVMSSMSVGTL